MDEKTLLPEEAISKAQNFEYIRQHERWLGRLSDDVKGLQAEVADLKNRPQVTAPNTDTQRPAEKDSLTLSLAGAAATLALSWAAYEYMEWKQRNHPQRRRLPR